jgi:hypothetical protein
MDPEVVQDTPGTCPKCGMALEPMTPSTAPSPELADFTRRMGISAALSLPLVILTMGPMLGLALPMAWHPYLNYAQATLASPVVLWAALPFFQRARDSLVNRSPNMWTLIGLGVAAAYTYSLLATFAPWVFPPAYQGAMGVETYFEASAVIITLVFLGQVLELRARARTGDAIRALMDLAPATALRVQPDGTFEVPLENIIAGDLVRVRAGDKVPVDGVVVEGASSVDESLLTGEALPVEKTLAAALTGDSLGADHRHGGRSPPVPCADTSAGRQGGGVVCAHGGGGGAGLFRRMDGLWANAWISLCHGGGRVGADHRLPLCAWPCHAHFHHHGGGAGGLGRGADQRRRSARGFGQGRYAGD